MFGRFRGRIRLPTGKPLEVFVYDLSVGGFSAEWPHKLRVGDRVWLRLERTESLAAIVCWTTECMAGCKFEHPLHLSTLKAIVEGRQGA